jgi:TolB-like protein
MRGEVTPALDRLIARCLAKNPDERWQTARDLLSELKWIAEPGSHPGAVDAQSTRRVRARVWIWPATAALAVLGMAPFVWTAKPAPIDAIAILPLANVTGDPDLEYLTDGIAESLINALSRVPHVKVMSSAAVARYKGRQVDAREVARELGVKVLVVGKVGQRGDALSISVEMVDAHDNHQIWGQQYNRPLAGIFAVQEDISKEIADNLRISLAGDAGAELAKRFTRSTEAYELYLKGRYYWNKRMPQDLTRSLEYFKQAIDVDPGYALAYAGLADAYNLLGSVGYDVLPPSDVIPKARAAAVQALALDDSLAEAHAAMAFVLRFEFDRPGAEREHRRSVALNPNYATGHQWLASHLWTQGQFDEALVELEQAQALDPMSPLISLNMGRHYYYARDFDRAIEHFAKTLQLDPRAFIAGQLMAMAYVEKGMPGSALEQLARSPAPPGPFLSVLGYVQAVNGDRVAAHRVIADMEALSKHLYMPPYGFALVYVGLGMKDAAFTQLERGRLEHSAYLDYLGVDPSMDRLRSDPRFAALLRRVGLSDVSSVRVAARATRAS